MVKAKEEFIMKSEYDYINLAEREIDNILQFSINKRNIDIALLWAACRRSSHCSYFLRKN